MDEQEKAIKIVSQSHRNMDGRELPRDGIRLSFSLDGLKEASSGYTQKYWKQGNSTFNQICGNIQYSLLEIRKLAYAFTLSK